MADFASRRQRLRSDVSNDGGLNTDDKHSAAAFDADDILVEVNFGGNMATKVAKQAAADADRLNRSGDREDQGQVAAEAAAGQA